MPLRGFRRASARLSAVLAALVITGLVYELPLPAAEAAPVDKSVHVPPLTSPSVERPTPASLSEADFSSEPGAERHRRALPADDIPPRGMEDKAVVERTASTTTYDNGNGTSTLVARGGVANFQDETGTWRQIDPRLHVVERGDAVNGAGPVSVRLAAATGRPDMVTLSGQGWSLSSGVEGLAGGRGAGVDGNTARYQNVLPGVDLEESVFNTRLKETFVLDAPPPRPLPATIRFPLSLKGLTPEAKDDGSIEFKHDGAVALTIPVGIATDSNQTIDETGLTPRAPVVPKLVKTDAGWAVDIILPLEWLADPARVYPVFIDPSYTWTAGATGYNDAGGYDGNTGSGCGNCWYDGNNSVEGNAYVNRIGYQNFNGTNPCPPGPGCTTWQFYSFLYFDLSRILGHEITDARFYGYVFQSGFFKIYPIAQPWSAPIGWSTMPNHRADNISVTPPDESDFDVNITGWAQNWSSGAWGSHGLSMDTAGQVHYVKLAAMEQAWQLMDPFIAVTFNDIPTPVPATADLRPADGAVITQLTTMPTLTSPAVADPDQDPVQYWFRVSTGIDGESGQVFNSGWRSSPAYQLPPNTLQDGVTYYWRVYTWGGWGTNWTPTSPIKFRVDLRLGSSGPSPMDTVGPVSVNMATGNVSVATGSPTLKTVGGEMGISYSYNSLAATPYGVTGAYYDGCNGTTGFPAQPTLVRRDSAVNFNWGGGSPAPGIIGDDDFCVDWNGLITVPRSQRYCFEAARDDGIRVWVNETLLLDSWYDQNSSPDWSNIIGKCIDLFSDQTNRLHVQYYERGGGAQATVWIETCCGSLGDAQPIPNSWYTTSALNLPAGWELSSGNASLSYSTAQIGSGVITLVRPDGSRSEFHYVNGGYVPQAGETSALSTTIDASGKTVVTVQGGDGLDYVFNYQGKLTAVRQAVDDANPAAAEYVYAADSGRVAGLRDPVSDKQMTMTYSVRNFGNTDNCPHDSDFPTSVLVPDGLLCQISYWDGTSTKLFYNASGQLARITDPGEEVTDFGYDGAGRLSTVRDPLQYDVVHAGLRANNDTTRTVIAYLNDGTNRVSSVTLAAPLVGDAQPQHAYRYVSATETQLDVAGMSPQTGYARKVVFDDRAKLTDEYNAAGLVNHTDWDDANERVLATTAPGNLKTVNVYDVAGRVTDVWGPAPASCFNGLTPQTCTPAIPHAIKRYDEGVRGLAAAYWDNETFAGPPKLHQTGVGDPTDSLLVNWSTGGPSGLGAADHFAARYTGLITFPAADYKLVTCGDDGTRAWIDDQLVVDAWNVVGCGTSTWTSRDNKPHRIRVDHREVTGLSDVGLYWQPPGSGNVIVPGTALSPSYGLVTSGRDPDGHETATQYAQPELGLPTATITYPDANIDGSSNRSATALRTVSAYEQGGLRRRLARTLPAGVANAYRSAVSADAAANHWRLAETAGTTAADSSGTQAGTYNSVALGQRGGLSDGQTAAGFDGSSSSVSLPTGILSASTTETVEAWFKTLRSGVIIGQSNAEYPNATNHVPVLYVGTDGKLRGELWQGSVSPITSSGVVNDGAWHHAVLTASGATQTLYLDGTAVGSLTGTINHVDMTTTTIGTGKWSGWPGASSSIWGMFSGAVGDVAVYRSALSASRVLAHFQAGHWGSTPTLSTYYGNTEGPVASACGATGSQAGLLKQTTDPAPATGPAIVRQYLYNAWGNVVGSRVGNEAWACTSYDPRQRLTQATQTDGKTLTNAYVTPGEVTTNYVDSAGNPRSTKTTFDLLGRTVAYRDELGTVTRTTYDQAGRPTATHRTLPGQAETQVSSNSYDHNGRISQTADYLSGSARTTTFGYDAATGRPTTITRPNGVVTTTGYDTDSGAVNALTHSKNGTALAPYGSWTYGRKPSGVIASETTNTGPSANRTRSFVYDGAGRLSSTTEGGTTRGYSFDLNSNRCGTTACDGSYSYDNTDRLLMSPYASSYTYDNHGNMISATPLAAQSAGALAESWAYDAVSPTTKTVPLTINSTGTIDADLDTTATPTYSSGTGSGSVAAGATWSTPVPVRGASFIKGSITWTQGTGGYAPLILRLKNGNGTVVKSVSGSSGALDISHVTPNVTLNWTLEVVNTSGTVNIPSFSLPWSATTATSSALSGNLATGVTVTKALTADGHGRLYATASYDQGVTTVTSTSTGAVAMGASTDSTVAATGAGAITASLDWSPIATYAAASPTGSLAPSATWSGLVPVEGRSYLKAALTWTASSSGMASVTLRFKDQTGAVVKTLSGSTGSLVIGYLTPDVAAQYTAEVVNNSSTRNVPSFSLQWSATTASTTSLSGGLATGAIATTALSAAGQGNLSASVSYDPGTKPVSSSPTGSVAMGETSDQTVSATGSGTISGSVDWAPLATYETANPTGSLAASGTWSSPVPVEGVSYVSAAVTWTASGSGLASTTLRLKDQAGSVMKTASGAEGSLTIGALTPDVGATYTMELVNDSPDKSVPSFSLVWSATTASVVPLSGSLSAGAISSTALAAAGPGTLSAAMSYEKGTKPVSSSPTGTVVGGGTSDETVDVTGTGPMATSVDWSSLPVYTADNASPAGNPGCCFSAPLSAKGPSYLYGLVTWNKGFHGEWVSTSGSVTQFTPKTDFVTVSAEGTIQVDVDWTPTTKSLVQFSQQASPTAEWTQTFTASADGTVDPVIRWTNGTIPSILELSLYDSAGNLLRTSGTQLGDTTARFPTPYSVTASLTNKKTYSLKVRDTGPAVSFDVTSGTHPVTANVDIELWNPAGTAKLMSTTGTTSKPERLVYQMPAGSPLGDYRVKVVSQDHPASYTGSFFVPRSDYADLTFRLKNGTTELKTISGATGSLELWRLTEGSEDDVLEVQNNSSWNAVGLSVVWSSTTEQTQALPGSIATGTTSTLNLSAADQGWINVPMTWAKDTHNVSTPISGTVDSSTVTHDLNVTSTGTISASVDWSPTTRTLRANSQQASPTAEWTRTFTASADGTVDPVIRWTNGTIPSILELSLYDSAGNLLRTSGTQLGDTTAEFDTPYSVTASLTNKKTYTLKVRDTGPAVSFDVTSGSYPATANVDLELWNPAGTTKLVSTTATTDKPESLTYTMTGASPLGAYKLKVVSRDFFASYTGSASVPSLDYAAITMRLKDGSGTPVKTMSSASGSMDLQYKAPAAGSYTLEVQNTSTDLRALSILGKAATPVVRTPNFDLDLYDPSGALVASSHSTSAKPETLSYTVPATGPFGNYRYRITSADWDSAYTLSETHQVSGHATVVGRLKNADGNVVASATSSDGSLAFDYLAAGAGNYTLELQNTSSDFAVPSYTGTASGVAQRTANLDLELYDPSGVKVASAANTPSAKPESLSYSVPANAVGNYTFKVVSRDYSADYTFAETHQVSGHATVVGRLKNAGGNVVASATSSDGSLAFDYLAAGAGNYTLELQNTSSDFAVPSYTGTASGVAQRTANLDLELYDPSGVKVASAANTPSAKPESLSYSVPAGALGNYTLKILSRDHSASWSMAESHAVSGFATVVGRLKNAGGAVVASTSSSNGSLAFDYLAAGAGNYTLELQNTSSDFAVPSYTGTATNVKERYGTFDFTLKDGAGLAVAIGSGTRPSEVSGSVSPGQYTLSVTPLTGSGTASLTGSYPRAAKEVITYDANDHATSIDDGAQTVVEVLSTTGRVLRRTVTDNATGANVEDTEFGYADDGDSPAYSWPVGGGAVTTYFGGGLLVDAGGTATWLLQNAHGDVVATADAAGAVTANPATDEFGVGDAPSSRLGWLGGKERYSTGGSLGLIRMGVRLYDPRLGRFLAADPVEGGSANDYDYCSADPVNCTDVSGLYGYRYEKRLFIDPAWTPSLLLSHVTNNFDKFFPLRGCGRVIQAGTVCGLRFLGLVNPVRVSSFGSNYFELVSLPGHKEGAGKKIRFSFHRVCKRGSCSMVLRVNASGPSKWYQRGPLSFPNTFLANQLWRQFGVSISQHL